MDLGAKVRAIQHTAEGTRQSDLSQASHRGRQEWSGWWRKQEERYKGEGLVQSGPEARALLAGSRPRWCASVTLSSLPFSVLRAATFPSYLVCLAFICTVACVSPVSFDKVSPYPLSYNETSSQSAPRRSRAIVEKTTSYTQPPPFVHASIHPRKAHASCSQGRRFRSGASRAGQVRPAAVRKSQPASILPLQIGDNMNARQVCVTENGQENLPFSTFNC